MALLVAAIFLAGSPGINAADPVKFISFDVAKVSPAGCKIMVTVEMLLDDLLFSDDVEPAWYGYFKYQPPPASQFELAVREEGQGGPRGSLAQDCVHRHFMATMVFLTASYK